MNASTICLVTIHGIGFQQPPVDPPLGNTPGYADDLHKNLSNYLDATLLSDDPERKRSQYGEHGPIYVQSVWPPDSHCREAGLRRLGTWDVSQPFRVDGSDAPLTNGKGRIAHIALVYSNEEGHQHQIGSSVIAGSMATISLGHYACIIGLIRIAFADLFAALEPHPKDDKVMTPSLRVRHDAGFNTHHHTPGHHNLGGFRAIIRQLENDVAAYVCHNDMRERVRGFVLNALIRLAAREDVAAIVINAHSNGTVIALDVLKQLPHFAARKIRVFITAGSPLRKYTDLFTWGEHVATVPKIQQWTNFWDEHDPVADPLVPCKDWRRGTEIKPEELTGLYEAIDPDSGETSSIVIQDRQVNNVAHSRGGLRAHNYWDNDLEFVQPLARILRAVAKVPEDNPVPA